MLDTDDKQSFYVRRGVAGAERDVRFRYGTVREHIKQHHPNCPGTIRSAIVRQVAGRDWTNCTLGQAVGIAMDGYVRHKMTDYERWYSIPGIVREEARLIVRQEVQDIISSWSSKPAVADGDPSAFIQNPDPVEDNPTEEANVARRHYL